MLVRFISKLEKMLLPSLSQQTFIIRTISSPPVLTVEQGKLKGSFNKLLDGTDYYSFKGIPYAQPPLGNQRFKAPLPPLPWKDTTYDASEHKGVCPQMDMFTSQMLEGNEDCLYLNVYSKNITKEKKPVMVFIHGGAFMSGSGDTDMYGPELLIQHDVVLVTINYRLEVLGFLCLDTEEAPGNAGMKDQVAALKWIKNNISNFGGDSNNITLVGESAGASSVTYHMVSPMSKNLFHKAIVQSGVHLTDWSYALDSVERAFRVGKLLGKDTSDADELVEFLRGVPAIKLAKVTFDTMTKEEKLRGLPIHFTPVVEKNFPNVEPFLNESAMNLLLANRIKEVPMIIGYNTAEFLPMVKFILKKLDFYNDNLQYKVQREVARRASVDKIKEFGERIKQFYFDGKDLTADMVTEMGALESDINFVYNINRFAHLYSAVTKAPLYMYKFGYESELNILKIASEMTAHKGACHADDLFYMFTSGMTRDLLMENNDLMAMSNVLTKLWTNFAKTGNPTPDSSLGVEWKPFTCKSKNYLRIETPLALDQNPDQKNVEFWNKIYGEAGLPCITQSNL